MRNQSAALVLALLVVGELSAQIIPSLPPSGQLGTGNRGSHHDDSHHGGRPRISVILSGSVTSGYFAPYPYFPPIGNSVTVITVYSPPPPVVVTAPTPQELEFLRQLNLAPREAPDHPAEQPPPGIRRIGPNNRLQLPPPVPPVPMPPPKFNPPVIPLPNPDRPADNPKDEHARLIKLGKDAFIAQQYGRAAERFHQAIAVVNEAPGHFLLAQADLALGKYFDAVDAIQDGLKLDPDWPMSPFRPQTLYGPDGDDFNVHLQRLQNALARHPDDPVLLFLYAYQLWFDGRRNEALPLFQRAAVVARDKAAIERFLQAKP